MKYNAFFKFLAVFLAVVCATCLLVSGICVAYNINYGLYTYTGEEQEQSKLRAHALSYADQVVEEYAFHQSGMPRELWEDYFGNGYLNFGVYPHVSYRIIGENGVLASGGSDTGDAPVVYTEEVEIDRWLGYIRQVGEQGRMYPTDPEPTASVTAPTYDPDTHTEETGATLPAGEANLWDEIVADDAGNLYELYRYEQMQEFTVVLSYTESEYAEVIGTRHTTTLMGEQMYVMRYIALGMAAVSGAVLILLLIYLGFAAGRKPGREEVIPGGLNRLPLDLYTAADCFVGFWLVWLLVEVVLDAIFGQPGVENVSVYWILLIGAGLCAGISLICVLYWCAFWAQVKANGFWWKNSVIGRILRGIWKMIAALLRKGMSAVTGVGTKVGDQVPGFADILRNFNNKLPLMWQWLAASMAIFAMLAFFGPMCHMGIGLIFYAVIVCFSVVAILYGAGAFGTLRDAAKRMSQGSLDVKIDPDTLEGCFRDFAEDLNALSEACIVAAREQLKSERMKTELITNVSHDIKTPLTSIINYVDLLQKAKTEEERKEYLAVLERQSARLKKLIEDLMEMSKASSGNVAAEIAPTDVAESVNQALGEYADRFATLKLSTVLRKPEQNPVALCDGKLLWRVLSNVLSNVVKYAMPGTRVYFDLTVSEYKVHLAVKNISREELNITAEELMERFVRGDASRNTEGNGLGLNIAKSLMEVQGGTLELLVDGDLFKVILTLPRASASDAVAEETDLLPEEVLPQEVLPEEAAAN